MARKPDKMHAFLWGLFSIGAFIAAFLLPVLIYVGNVAYPLGLWPVQGRQPITPLLVSLLSTAFLFATLAFSFFHGIFRFQTTLPELGLTKYSRIIEIAGYIVIGLGLLILLFDIVALNPNLMRLI